MYHFVPNTCKKMWINLFSLVALPNNNEDQKKSEKNCYLIKKASVKMWKSCTSVGPTQHMRKARMQ